MLSDFHFLCVISGLLMAGSIAAVDVLAPGCPPDWTRLGSRCFIFQNSYRSMGDAENICLSLGGNLASVHSAAENRLLRELIRKGSGSYVHTWIGGYDGIKEGQWMWTDGSNFDYQIWGPGEPNNHGGAENCIEMNWAVEYWNDLPCFYGKPFVCAKDL